MVDQTKSEASYRVAVEPVSGRVGPLSEVRQTISVGKLTFAPGLPELRAEQTIW